MHSDKALTSMIFQFVNAGKSIALALSNKPDDQAEWRNILQLMYHLRQALACAVCGKLVSDPYTPAREQCHCICAGCRNASTQFINNNCVSCRHASQSGGDDGFEINPHLNHTKVGFVQFCKLLVDKATVHKWSNLQVSTQNGPITFGQLIHEGCNSDNLPSGHNLGEKFKKKVKEKEQYCRCGSGAKKSDNKSPGNLTCLGQRCTCYRKGKGCTNCRCVGCKNPNGVSANGFPGVSNGTSSLTSSTMASLN